MSKFTCNVCGQSYRTNRDIYEFNICIGCEQDNPVVCKLSKDLYESNKEINRLTIAYQNASEQRQHYVDKCLKLSEVVLEFYKLIDSYFEESIKRVDNLDDQDQMAIFLDHKYGDLICELKRNLEVKGV